MKLWKKINEKKKKVLVGGVALVYVDILIPG